MPFRWLIALSLLAGLTACSPTQAIPTPTPTLEVWRLQYTPALSWMGSVLNHCASQQPNTGLLVKEVAAPYLDLQEADLLLRWGESGEITGHAVILGYDYLMVAVHPDNPIESLTAADLAAIFTGQIVTWDELDPTLPAEAITVWSYPEGSEIRLVFDQTFQAYNPLTLLHLAPGPGEMREALSVDPHAVGYLPDRWVDNSLQAVMLDDVDLDLEKLHVPILGISSSPPEGKLRDWLLCLQSEITPQ